MLIDHSFGCQGGSAGACCKTVDCAEIRHGVSTLLHQLSCDEAQALVTASAPTATEQAARDLKAKNRAKS
ncbi:MULTISPECIES: hypothetical protein [unclassified Mesorhizobium]|uniref:hypothetical protein n=1 Tax=unclassified Mesorhizobium TaxID=325217 RepID=UPI000FDA3883|nr:MULTISPECIES: hypothetical protein [unclassified Mesorhizobium]TGR47221.1 hypothetical protein EN842_22950 [bacterium M00.F.Ca.ET.199.01.1.1]TGU36671.1 hypothetical protein EN799_13730 [bacterium M00.F.Ca.ET.156.01.1.1]TGV87859.1 hypothetical protein EN792_009975 [Mesorhizobium sp. M00.F.Ca.ET.149.01.1.1]TGR28933.1 hypothetical protein EN845_11225 [Mesorhizobium sp. M8A.F.Ca.ET.202.01.1.1]TGR29841.1 hypothetical protein EN840_09130 [Mesorhizobium sp. M8A.F.Ca.ET.197.01.1.1]